MLKAENPVTATRSPPFQGTVIQARGTVQAAQRGSRAQMTTCRQSLHPEKGTKSGRLQAFSLPSEESPAQGAVPARGPGEQTQVKVTCAARRGPSLSRMPE